MRFYNKRLRTGSISFRSGAVSLVTLGSIVALILFCAAAWSTLSALEQSYYSVIKSRKNIGVAKAALSMDAAQVVAFPPAEHSSDFSTKAAIHSRPSTAPATPAPIRSVYAWCNVWSDAWKMYARERQVANWLKRYAAAQRVYYRHTGTYAHRATELIITDRQGALRIIDRRLSQLNYAMAHREPLEGYCFFYPDSVAEAGYGLIAVPAVYGTTGVNTLYIDQAGTVWGKDTGAQMQYPAGDARNDWRRFR